MLKAHTTAILCITALALSACGGGNDSADKNGKDSAKTPTPSATATSTPTPGPKPKPKPPACEKVEVKGIDVCKVGLARDRFLALCGKRQTKPSTRDDKTDMTDLRKATTALVRAFRANPDEKWRRGKGLPNLTMRIRLVSLRFVARNRCGGGDAVKLGDRMTRALVKVPVER